MQLPHHFARRFVQLVIGLFLYGIGISLMVQAAQRLGKRDEAKEQLEIAAKLPDR